MTPTDLNINKMVSRKKPYKKPILVVHGNLRHVTNAKGSQGSDKTNTTKPGGS
jgi:hypothetical protein